VIRWHERSSSFRAYQKNVASIVSSMTKAQRSLDDIKRLAGPTRPHSWALPAASRATRRH
jgi:hypothetical protein